MNTKVKLQTLYFFIFASMGVIKPLIGQYLDSIGFTGTQIGTAASVATATAIGASTFWGHRYANSKDGRKVILLLCISAAVMGLVNSFISAFVIFVIGYGIMYFFQGPLHGCADAMVLELGEEFAGIRLWGSIGFAVAVFLGGRIGDAYGLKNIFYIYAVSYLIGAFIVMRIKVNSHALSTEEKKEENKEDKASFYELFADKKVIQLIFCGIFICGTNVANNTYFSFLYLDGGGTVSGFGTTFLLMVGCEAPFMALAAWLSGKIGREKSIVVATLISILRFAWYATNPSHQLLMGTFFLQGITNGIILVEYVKYVSGIVRPRLIGIAVAAYYAISSHIGTIICDFFGGVAMDHFGSSGVYALFAGLNLFGLVLYIVFGLHKKECKKPIDNAK